MTIDLLRNRPRRLLAHGRPLANGRPLALSLAAVCVAATLAGSAAFAAAPGADSVLRDFEPTGDYVLWVAGKEVPKAEVYSSRVAGALLVLSSAFPSPVLLSQRSQSAETVDLMKVAKQEDGSIDLLADATLEPAGSFQLTGEDVVFKVQGKEGRLKLKPPLTGLHVKADLLAHSPEYAKGASSYKPDANTMARLMRVGVPATVKVFFGSWCPHCKQNLPHVLKMEEMLAGSKITFQYYGLPRPPEAWKEAEAVRVGVKSVPTAIILSGGKEIGRIQAEDWLDVEKAMITVLQQLPVAGG
jgi:thiol-disulfide isomerase/thioredoxin